MRGNVFRTGGEERGVPSRPETSSGEQRTSPYLLPMSQCWRSWVWPLKEPGFSLERPQGGKEARHMAVGLRDSPASLLLLGSSVTRDIPLF